MARIIKYTTYNYWSEGGKLTKMTRHIVRVQSKNGALYIHLPKQLVDRWNLNKGEYVEILVDDEKAIIRKI